MNTRKESILIAEVHAIPIDKTFIPDNLLFGGRFAEVLKGMSDEFMRHFPEKGDSWEECDISNLIMVLDAAFEAYWDDVGSGSENERHQLIDIANICLMLATRLGESDKVSEAIKKPDRY